MKYSNNNYCYYYKKNTSYHKFNMVNGVDGTQDND